LAEYKREIGAAVTVGIVLGAFVAILAISTTPSTPIITTSNTNSLRLTSVTSSQEPNSSSSTASGANCLLLLPIDAQLSEFANSTFYGNSVTFPNGTQVFFSDYSCPRPALGETSNGVDIYAMAVAAEINSNFVAAENGSQFLYQWPSGIICTVGGNETCSLELFFYRYGNSSRNFVCGRSTIIQREALAGIMVTFRTIGTYDANGVLVGNTWDLQNPLVQTMSAEQIDSYYANGFPCG
jgi:hypothetical protein